MAVFTALATAIVGAFATAGTIFGSALLFNTVVGVVAAGLAFATAKVLGVFEAPTGNYQDPGVKIQLAPDTSNKIGIAYGRNFMSGPITDVAISNQNKTMHYCITLSEYVEGGTYTVNQVFRDTANLNFSGANVISQTNKNSTNVVQIANKIRCRVYAGNTNANAQIFPSSGAVNATTMMPHWTNTTDYSMEDLVFAMIEVDYDNENGLTGLGAINFDITNSVSNPGNVLIDYLNNSRYGCGLSNDIIDVNSITGTANTSLYGYSAEQVSYINNANVSVTQDRWQINGMLSAFDNTMSNIDKICQNCATWFMFDSKQGKFKVIPNRPTASTFSLNDDNIISKISVSSTELYSLFNVAEVEYADKNRRDQQNLVRVETPAGLLNPNEPENIVSYRLDMVNDNVRAQNLANIDLNQARKGMVVTCTVDYTGIQIDVGDVVDITNDDYGFVAKEFRVVKTTENMNDGTYGVALTLLEYDPDIYITPANVVETGYLPPTDIAVVPVVPALPPTVFNTYITGITTYSTSGSGVGANFTVFKNPQTALYTYVYPVSGGSGFAPGDTVTVSGTYLGGVEPLNNLTFTVATVSAGAVTEANSVSGTALVYDPDIYGGYIQTGAIGNASVGTQVEDKPAPNVSISNADVIADIIPVRPLDFLKGSGLEPGEYSFIAGVAPIGSLVQPTANYSLVANVNIEYGNGYVQNEYFGINADNIDNIPSILEANQKITISEGAVNGNVVLKGRNTLNPNPSAEIGFTNMRYDWMKINKADIF